MFVDEWGHTFEVTVKHYEDGKLVAKDLSNYSVSFLFHKPSGNVVAVAATVPKPKKGIAFYTTPEGFIDEIGVWRWQIMAERDDGLFYTDFVDQVVRRHLVET